MFRRANYKITTFAFNNKIEFIKVVRGKFNLGLKEAKDIVDNLMCGTSQFINTNINIDELVNTPFIEYSKEDQPVIVSDYVNKSDFDNIIKTIITNAVDQDEFEFAKDLIDVLGNKNTTTAKLIVEI